MGSSGFLKFTLVGVHQRDDWIKHACFPKCNLGGINWKINSSGASVFVNVNNQPDQLMYKSPRMIETMKH